MTRAFRYKKIVSSLICLLATSVNFAAVQPQAVDTSEAVTLKERPGFFRFSFDNVDMPNNMRNMGLLGINYFADITPDLYGGVGGYGSITGTQGGLFVLGLGAGLHKQFAPNWWVDIGMFAGGGGGRSSLVGGGLMLRPQAGIQYAWHRARIGLHYSYIDFPSGQIRSHQAGLDLDIPFDFYYVSYRDIGETTYQIKDVLLPIGKYFALSRNDFILLLQAYDQRSGTKNVNGDVQDGTIGVVGAEFDHYLTDNTFMYVKAGGAFSGIPNGYMDVLGGLGYHWQLNPLFALVPQFGIGAGGGGNVDTGGGVLLQPQLGVEIPLTTNFATRLSAGYLWAPDGELQAATGTAELIYHLNIAAASTEPVNHLLNYFYRIHGWRIYLFNQTYDHPQRAHTDKTSAINLVAVQVDQLFNRFFFLSYQAAFAYSGYNAGGYATGMIGPGFQTPRFFNDSTQLFANVLVGAGGGGGLALGGGALIEPVIGLHYTFTPALGVEASVGQLKALRSDLNTPVYNLGLVVRFGTLNQEKAPCPC